MTPPDTLTHLRTIVIEVLNLWQTLAVALLIPVGLLALADRRLRARR